ncbi:putative cytochrome b5 [Phakopsora pachyrhizi]|uniref:Cytochrome b5 n=1 Tax=Phakopsora pachyrhizi TaxID=170000 RepID=A0AAV0AZN8_PHAPC|nr:putative cytochrome b5 [Phakopsora pachyrhizi]
MPSSSSSSSPGQKDFTIEELKELNRSENLHLSIHGKVYSIAKFLDDHPGGDEVLISESGGKDATESFEDVGHSDEARSLMEKYYVGTCSELGPKKTRTVKSNDRSTDEKSSSMGDSSSSDGGGFGYLVPLAVLIAYLSYRFYFGS